MALFNGRKYAEACEISRRGSKPAGAALWDLARSQDRSYPRARESPAVLLPDRAKSLFPHTRSGFRSTRSHLSWNGPCHSRRQNSCKLAKVLQGTFGHQRSSLMRESRRIFALFDSGVTQLFRPASQIDRQSRYGEAKRRNSTRFFCAVVRVFAGLWIRRAFG